MVTVTRNIPLGHDYNHAEDPTYKNYREEAQRWYDKRLDLSNRSQAAFKNGDKQVAHELSEQLKEAFRKAEDFNKKAAQYVFVQNNADSKDNEVDLHGLYVNEAKWILQKRIANCVETSQLRLLVIVGKGNHSVHGVAKLKPAVDEMCSEAGLSHYIDKKNPGVLVIDFPQTPNIKLPNSWDTKPLDPQNALYGPGPLYQPQYQQQPYHQPYQQQRAQNRSVAATRIPIVDFLLKLVCACIK